MAKANSAASFKDVLVQDLSLGEGQAVENGDCLEVAYTGWLLQNYTIGQVMLLPSLSYQFPHAMTIHKSLNFKIPNFEKIGSV